MKTTRPPQATRRGDGRLLALTAGEQAGLKLSAQLLKLATVVRRQP